MRHTGIEFGILLSECQEVFAHNNTLGPSNDYGIHLNDSSFCNVQGNDVFGNMQDGIDCVKGSSNAINWNTVYDNAFYGIVCWEVNGFNIHHNLVYQNVDGIGVNMAPASQVTYNNVQNNTGVGITVSWGSTDCDIYGNHIGWNTGGNSMDDGSSNMWDNGINMGNFWSDYSGTGTYSIPGAAWKRG